jgi:hypothetical protein
VEQRSANTRLVAAWIARQAGAKALDGACDSPGQTTAPIKPRVVRSAVLVIAASMMALASTAIADSQACRTGRRCSSANRRSSARGPLLVLCPDELHNVSSY